MKIHLKAILVAVTVVVVLAGCATGEYTASSPMVHVGPSKGWRKSGVDGKDAYLAWQQCIQDAQKQPEYQALKRDADAVQIRRYMSKAEMERMSADNAFIGKYSDDCMKRQDFTYGKYTSLDQSYVPPRPPEQGWQKPGVSYQDALSAKSKCLDQEYNQAYLNKCMAAQGFVYGVLKGEQ
ncbi:hypothetical protein AB4Y64_11065 [Lysobacter sp. TAF61]|uniref:hypothetical protein n=1 Tax=Lysobacter sp. TAF61 TaxID=3233072 RepID=UPI003F9B972A